VRNSGASKVLLIETLAGEEHPDWYVFGADYDAKLISLCEMLPRVFADDGEHFRPETLESWSAVFTRETWSRQFPDRPMRVLDCLEDERYWLLIHSPPRLAPLRPEPGTEETIP
jgi:hypothetical protein